MVQSIDMVQSQSSILLNYHSNKMHLAGSQFKLRCYGNRKLKLKHFSEMIDKQVKKRSIFEKDC